MAHVGIFGIVLSPGSRFNDQSSRCHVPQRPKGVWGGARALLISRAPERLDFGYKLGVRYQAKAYSIAGLLGPCFHPHPVAPIRQDGEVGERPVNGLVLEHILPLSKTKQGRVRSESNR